MWSKVLKGWLVLGFLILPRESLAAFFAVVGMALVISMSIFAKCYSSPAGDSLDISLKVTASCVRVVNTRVLREDWGLTLKPSAGTNDSSKGIDLMSVQACQMCLDLTLPHSGRCFCSHLMAGMCHLCACGTSVTVTAGRAGILLLGWVWLLPACSACTCRSRDAHTWVPVPRTWAEGGKTTSCAWL